MLPDKGVWRERHANATRGGANSNRHISKETNPRRGTFGLLANRHRRRLSSHRAIIGLPTVDTRGSCQNSRHRIFAWKDWNFGLPCRLRIRYMRSHARGFGGAVVHIRQDGRVWLDEN